MFIRYLQGTYKPSNAYNPFIGFISGIPGPGTLTKQHPDLNSKNWSLGLKIGLDNHEISSNQNGVRTGNIFALLPKNELIQNKCPN